VHSASESVLKLLLLAVCELFWGLLGRGEGGLRVIGVSRRGYNEVLVLDVQNVVDCVELRRRAEPPASASVPR